MNAEPPAWLKLLDPLVQSLHARGGCVWLFEEGLLRLAAATGLSPGKWIVAEDVRQRRQQCVVDVMRNRQARVFDVAAPEVSPEIGPATLYLMALLDQDRCWGLVEIVQRPRLPQQQQQGYLSFLEEFCRRRDLPRPPRLEHPPMSPAVVEAEEPTPITPPDDDSAPTEPAAPDWPAMMTCLQQVQTHQRLREVAESMANETRLLFASDRVSVGIPTGRAVRIVAVSGLDRVQRRSNLVRAMAVLAQLIVATKEPFRFEDTIDELSPSLERPLTQFTQLGGARMVLVLPLLEPAAGARPTDAAESNPRRDTQRTVAGVLIIEQFRESRPHPRLVAHLELIREHLATALSHARSYESIFLLPVWSGLGRAWSALRGRTLAWSCVIAAALVASGAALVWVPWNYRVEGQGQLMPVVQRDIFAPWDGQVTELLVRGGDRVSAEQPLVRLRNEELAAEQVKTRGELGEKRKLVVSLFAQLDDAERTAQREEETRLRGKVAETQIEVEGLTERLGILTERIDRLTVRAPFAGVVTTFQAEQLLLNRPVRRGDVMLQVMDDRGDWQLELDVAEQRLGHILAAQARSTPNLPITFRLLTRPEESYQAELQSIGTRSVTSDQRGSVVELRASLDATQISQPSIGAQVRARIDCGQKPLGYCLFGDVIEFVQKYLWW